MATKNIHKVRTPIDRLQDRMRRIKRIAPDAKHKTRFLELIRGGVFPTDICAMDDMPSYSAMRKAAHDDDEFADALADAIAVLADMTLEDAAAFARDVSHTGTTDDQRAADIYCKTMIAALEKLSPGTHGAMLKHAGHDGGAITVRTVNYSELTNDEPEKTASHTVGGTKPRTRDGASKAGKAQG